MTLIEEIHDRLRTLPPEKQSEVLDFIAFLQQRLAPATQQSTERSLSRHPAFGSWRGRHVDALQYEQALRAEWDARS